MKEIMLVFLVGLFLAFFIVYLLFGKKIKQSYVNQLGADVKEELLHSRARTISFDDEEHYKKKAWKQLGGVALITLVTIVLIVVMFLARGERDIVTFLMVCLFLFVLMMVLGIIFAARDANRVNRGQMIMITKAYIYSVIIARGKHVGMAYYDHIKQEIVTTSTEISSFHKDLRDINKGDYVEILVKEKKNNLKFIDFR